MLLENGFFTVDVVGRRFETPDVVSLQLALPDGGALPAWTPGAHIDIAVGDAGVRQYSLNGDPNDRRHWRVGVLLERGGRGGSQHLHREAVLGSSVTISLPRNNFPLVASASYCFVAGGIGITPLLPMIASAEAAGADWTLHYGGRSLEQMAYRADLAKYDARVVILPQDEFGLLPLQAIFEGRQANTSIYCCGPEPLLEAAEAAHVDGTLHVERFAPRAQAEVGIDDEFEVQIASTGERIRVGAEQSIVEALEDSGITIATSCREGTCASCETGVLDGQVIHRDSVLSEAEREKGSSIMLCVSRAQSGVLVLDL